MSILISLAFVAIIGALVLAGVVMLKGGAEGSRSGRMMRALALRVALSIALFACILVAWRLGWLQPTGVPLAR